MTARATMKAGQFGRPTLSKDDLTITGISQSACSIGVAANRSFRDDVGHRSRRLMARVSAMISRTGSPLSGGTDAHKHRSRSLSSSTDDFQRNVIAGMG